MYTVLGCVVILIISGVAALPSGKSYARSTLIGVGGTVAACIAGLYPAVSCLVFNRTMRLHLPWQIPFGAFDTALDPLSAFFLLPVLIISAVSAVYGACYLEPEKETGHVGSHWLFFNLLVAGMIMVVVARNGLLFLISWEVMSLAPFFLVLFNDGKSSAREAAWTYLVAAHAGGICLVVLFVLMGWHSAFMDFTGFSPENAVIAPSWLFLLALVGFGAKAGFIPLHVWLPEAHPAAPSHVSALMSGVMIKMGIYGIVRIITLLGPPPAWWGMLMIGIGLTSGILGVLFALSQHDLKRLLAYHSVENIGIIALGLGVGLLGLSADMPVLAVLGFTGGLLHVINHSLFKGLLFLGAGSVLHATHTMEIDHLGGLLKKMPVTGILFLTGAVAICGLPPLNGFISEFIIYLGSLKGLLSLDAASTGAMIVTLAGLAMIGGLAAACFTKAFGIIFLGDARSPHAENVNESGLAMLLPMAVPAGLCVIIGLGAPWVVAAAGPAVTVASSLSAHVVAEVLDSAMSPLLLIVYLALMLTAAMVLIIAIRKMLIVPAKIGLAETWGCGYAAPTPRMQYTSSSFAQPITAMFNVFLNTKTEAKGPEGLFPPDAAFASETPDIFNRIIYQPVFNSVARMLSLLQWIQHGRVQLYILYIVVTVFAVFFWKLF